MKTPVFLLLAVVNLIHCQDREHLIEFTIQEVWEALKIVAEKLKELSRDTKQCLRGEDLEHLTNISVENECSEGGNPCGARGTCHNSLFSFSCSCPSGFTWDGSDCADIDECAKGKGVCSPNAVCHNSIGSYSCSCNKPFEGDGRTSCEIRCRSPARFVKDLGCLKHVENLKPFQYQTEICRKEGGRMLQKFDSRHLTDIMKTFGYRAIPGRGWVGVYNGTWSTDKSLVPEDLWIEGSDRSDPEKPCGFLEWYGSSSSFKVVQLDCSRTHYVWCQYLLP
ncbi:adhesion G protein-coupled receptor L4-like isoform X2 [Palaemon carinicauda]|uniref:adhesion G protein-coupled receptor L4-like isoform X2 n=1 Tax=Palaemon carinicauda TaxID=392227 RepID=UPI0035B66257